MNAERKTRKYTEADADQLIPAGYERISSYVNSHATMQVRCPNNHIWKTTLNRILLGVRCGTCSGRARQTNEDFDKILREGWRRVGDYVNSNTKIHLICPNGHDVFARPPDYKNGTGCPTCSQKARRSISYVQERVPTGWRVLSKEYKNAYTSLLVLCDRGHLFKMSWLKIESGRRCPACNIDKDRAEMEATIDTNLSARGYTRISRFISPENKILVRCNRGHIYSTKWNAIRINKSGCMRCFYDWFTGPNHPWWREDLTDEDRNKSRSMKGYKSFLERVKKRDGNICMICGETDRPEVHHLYSWAWYPEHRINDDAAVTICREHHDLYHGLYGNGTKENTPEQFQDFLNKVCEYRDLPLAA